MSDTSFAFLQSRCIDVPDALYARSEELAQTVTHHMCTFIVMGFSMDAAMSRSVTETGEKSFRRWCRRRGLHDCARLRSNTVRIWYATERADVFDVFDVRVVSWSARPLGQARRSGNASALPMTWCAALSLTIRVHWSTIWPGNRADECTSNCVECCAFGCACSSTTRTPAELLLIVGGDNQAASEEPVLAAEPDAETAAPDFERNSRLVIATQFRTGTARPLERMW